MKLAAKHQPPTSPAHRAAWRKGYAAHRSGVPLSKCPYIDHRTTYHEGVTFSRSYIAAWERGWNASAAGAPDTSIIPPKFKTGDPVFVPNFKGSIYLKEATVLSMSRDGYRVTVSTRAATGKAKRESWDVAKVTPRRAA